jgi:hypothetical protein
MIGWDGIAFLLGHYWPYAVGAALVGVAAGWLSLSGRSR